MLEEAELLSRLRSLERLEQDTAPGRPAKFTTRELLAIELQNYTSYPTSFVDGATRSAIVYRGFRGGMTRADVQTR